MKRKIPTILLYAGFGLAVLVLLMAIKFPWTVLADRLSSAVNASGVAHLSYLEAKPSRFPPGLVLEGVALASAQSPDTPLFTAGRVRLTPAWLTLLTGRAGVKLRAEAYGGELHGRIKADGLLSPDSIEAEFDLDDLDLGRHPQLAEQAGMQGILSGRVTLAGPLNGSEGFQGNADLVMRGGAARYKSNLLTRDVIRLGTVQADLSWLAGRLGVERLALTGGDLQGEFKGSFQSGQGDKALRGGRLTVDGTLLVDPSLLHLDRIPDRSIANRLRRKEPLHPKWNGPVAPLVGMAGLL